MDLIAKLEVKTPAEFVQQIVKLEQSLALALAERDAAEDVARTARALAASALEPFADVYSGGEGFEGHGDDEKAFLTCGRVKHYGLTLGCFKNAAIAFKRLSLISEEGG